MSKKPVCRTCTGPVQYGALYCCDWCEAHHDNKSFDFTRALKAEGFIQDERTPNVFHRDGIAVTLETAKRLGMAQTLVRHSHAKHARS